MSGASWLAPWPPTQANPIVGIVLAAGAGRRMGMPKALIRDTQGTPWLVTACKLLQASACQEVLAVLGAEARQAAKLLPAGVQAVIASDWEKGLSASLAAGLDAAAGSDATAALIALVDTPNLTLDIFHRVLEVGITPDTLARAIYHTRPGHPVLIGRNHWNKLLSQLKGDTGAQQYLNAHLATQVECGDLGDGNDIDTPPPEKQPDYGYQPNQR